MTSLAFIFDADYRTRDLMLSWDDGLRAALGLLAKDWQVEAFVPNGYADFSIGNIRIFQRPTRRASLNQAKEHGPFDFALCWGSLDRKMHGAIREIAPKTALCFAGGPTQHPYLSNFDLIFAETPFHVKQFEAQGTNVRQAFGVNTDLFKPNPWQTPHFLAVHPAAFADYKRYGLFAEAFGEQGLAVGQVQLRPDGSVFEGGSCHEVCLKNGVAVIPRMVPYYLMPYIYGLAETCVITSTTYGGGDRAVLEAMACGKPTVVCNDNVKLTMLQPPPEFCNQWRADPNPKLIRHAAEAARDFCDGGKMAGIYRQFVLENYSVEIYAQQLREGLESL